MLDIVVQLDKCYDHMLPCEESYNEIYYVIFTLLYVSTIENTYRSSIFFFVFLDIYTFVFVLENNSHI